MEAHPQTILLAVAALAIVVALYKQKAPSCNDAAYRYILIALLAAVLLFAMYRHFTRKLDAAPDGAGAGAGAQQPQAVLASQGASVNDATTTSGQTGIDASNAEQYINYDSLQAHYNDIQAAPTASRRVAGSSAGAGAATGPTASVQALAAANKLDFSEFSPVAQPSAAGGSADAPGKVMHGNFLDVTTKDVNAHAAISNNALIPVMEQYMKIHENDPTRHVTLQNSMGLAFYDTRDPVNVKISDFPSSISAKLPIA